MPAGSQWTFSPVIETAWGDSALNLRAILPGISQQDLKVSVQNNQLIIEGERKTPEHYKNTAHTQLAYGKFYAAVGVAERLERRQAYLPAAGRDSGCSDSDVRADEASPDSDSIGRKPQEHFGLVAASVH